MTWDIPALANSVVQIVGKFVPDKDAQAKIQAELQVKMLEMQQQELSNQAETNKVEAAHPHPFVAGWRPGVGWACALGFFWQVFGQPFFSFFYTLSTKQPAPVVNIPDDMIMPMLFALLGIGGLRTIERLQGKIPPQR